MCVCVRARVCVDEVRRAVNLMASGKAPCIDSLPAQMFKAGGLNLITNLTHLFQNIWNKWSVPQEFRNALIVHIFKRKGDRSVCDDHRGIFLLSIPGKILGRVILNRLSKHVDDIGRPTLPESPCGFRACRSTMYMIFTARQQQRELLLSLLASRRHSIRWTELLSGKFCWRSAAPQILSPSSALSMKACGQVSLRTVKYLQTLKWRMAQSKAVALPPCCLSFSSYTNVINRVNRQTEHRYGHTESMGLLAVRDVAYYQTSNKNICLP